MASLMLPIFDGDVTAVPKDKTVPDAARWGPLSVRATIDGSAAASSFLPALQLISPGGRIMWTAVTSESVAAGASADVSWFPRVGGGAAAGGGIQFDTNPQDGDWLYVKTTDSVPAPSGFDTELASTDGTWIHSAGNSIVESATGLTLRSSGGNILMTATGFGKHIQISADDPLTLSASGGVILIDGSGIHLGAVALPTTIDLGVGSTFTVNDSGGNPLMEVRDDDTLHIKTGTAWVADL